MPEIRRNDSLSASCQYFSTILSQDPTDLAGLQAIVDTFPSNKISQQAEPIKPPPVFTKRKEEPINSYEYGADSTNGFNPSKTFGGERSRFNLYPAAKKPEPVDPYNGTDSRPAFQTSKSLSSMENIYRTFLENQQKL